MLQQEVIHKNKEEILEEEIQRLSMQMDKFRKSQFAKIGEVKKMAELVKSELEQLKTALCGINTISNLVKEIS